MTGLKLVALGALLVASLPACSGWFGCDLMYRFPSLEMMPSKTVNAPGTLTLKSDGLGNGCGENRPRATSVAFYADDVRIGTDNSFPFEVTWQIAPGRDGIPATGNKTVNVYAVINTANMEESQRVPVQVNAVGGAP